MRRGSAPVNRDIASTLSQYEIVTNSVLPTRSSRSSCTPSAFFSSWRIPCSYRYSAYSSALCETVRPRQIRAIVGCAWPCVGFMHAESACLFTHVKDHVKSKCGLTTRGLNGRWLFRLVRLRFRSPDGVP